MAWLTDAQLLADLADTLQKTQGDLVPYWSNILTQEHAKAYNWLVSALLPRGFTLAQITGWDMGPFYERDLTLWQTLRRGAALQAVDDKLLGTLDVRKEIQELQCLSVGGVFLDPAGTAGQVVVGQDDTSGDTFVYPDRASGTSSFGQALGDVTQW